jgi:hypothetical protein
VKFGIFIRIAMFGLETKIVKIITNNSFANS